LTSGVSGGAVVDEDSEDGALSSSDDPITRWADRVSLLELWLSRERGDNASLRSRIRHDEASRAQMESELARINQALLDQHDDLQRAKQSVFNLHQRLEQHDLSIRMDHSRQVLTKLGVHADVMVPTKLPSPSASAGAAAALSSSALQSSGGSSNGRSSNSCSNPLCAAALSQLQSELVSERSRASELRTLHSLSHDSESSLREQVRAQTTLALEVQRRLRLARKELHDEGVQVRQAKEQVQQLEQQAQQAQRETAHLQRLLRLAQRPDAQQGVSSSSSFRSGQVAPAPASFVSAAQSPSPIPLHAASDCAHPSLRFAPAGAPSADEELEALTAGAHIPFVAQQQQHQQSRSTMRPIRY
jgi:hypothetical protein